MNRRSLFKIIASATLAAAIEVTGLVPVVKKVVTKVIVNPEYLNAEYEDTYIGIQIGSLTALPRYTLEGGKFVKVPYYKVIEEEVPV